jgi:hypothetical protein
MGESGSSLVIANNLHMARSSPVYEMDWVGLKIAKTIPETV